MQQKLRNDGSHVLTATPINQYTWDSGARFHARHACHIPRSTPQHPFHTHTAALAAIPQQQTIGGDDRWN